MSQVRSTDGTEIAYTARGSGPPVVFVDGAMCFRGMGPSQAVAKALAERYTVFTYDRRGRGESGDTAPYSVAREVEDLAAVVDAAGGSARLVGVSSGAALALEAAAAGVPVGALALYEAPFWVEGSPPAQDATYADDLAAALAADRRADAVRLFMRRVGVPGPMIALMRFMPAWSKIKGIAHTLPYDEAVLEGTRTGTGLPTDRWARISAPILSIAGGKSPEPMKNAMKALADGLATARYQELPGQTHMVKAKVLGPVIAEFFGAQSSASHDAQSKAAA